MSDQKCKIRPVIMNINSNEPLFYPYSVLANQCSGSCNDINNSYAKLHVPDFVKDMNIKRFNQCQELMKQVMWLRMIIMHVNVDWMQVFATALETTMERKVWS